MCLQIHQYKSLILIINTMLIITVNFDYWIRFWLLRATLVNNEVSFDYWDQFWLLRSTLITEVNLDCWGQLWLLRSTLIVEFELDYWKRTRVLKLTQILKLNSSIGTKLHYLIQTNGFRRCCCNERGLAFSSGTPREKEFRKFSCRFVIGHSNHPTTRALLLPTMTFNTLSTREPIISPPQTYHISYESFRHIYINIHHPNHQGNWWGEWG